LPDYSTTAEEATIESRAVGKMAGREEGGKRGEKRQDEIAPGNH
jgi:hypothetical protein